ncbi:MAG: DNA-binding protein [Deltaproteobacteria bacterium]|nr:DNA-binding protein [Deltaproteobacteria bacterium]
MQFREGRIGRIFVLQLEEGERLPEAVETFAREQGLMEGMVIYVGGAQDGSRLVVGPEAGRGDAIIPLVHTLSGIQEVLGVGTLFPNEAGDPVLHLHAAAGREGGATVGCSRAGVDVWLVGEVIILEVVGAAALRRRDPKSGFTLLNLG